MLKSFGQSLAYSVTLLAIGICGCSDGSSEVGPPTGKTGNQWEADDFADSSSKLALEGGPDFVAFCKDKGSCELKGPVLDKFKAVLAKYPVADSEEYDHFAVVIRDGLIESGLVEKGDPQRYQYKVSMMAIALSGE